MTTEDDLICSWCDAEGKDNNAHPHFPTVRIAKCSECNHEWLYIPSEDLDEDE